MKLVWRWGSQAVSHFTMNNSEYGFVVVAVVLTIYNSQEIFLA
jgi:hypothetical protein